MKKSLAQFRCHAAEKNALKSLTQSFPAQPATGPRWELRLQVAWCACDVSTRDCAVLRPARSTNSYPLMPGRDLHLSRTLLFSRHDLVIRQSTILNSWLGSDYQKLGFVVDRGFGGVAFTWRNRGTTDWVTVATGRGRYVRRAICPSPAPDLSIR